MNSWRSNAYGYFFISSQTAPDAIVPHRRLFALLDSRPVLQQPAVSHGRQHQSVHHHGTGNRKTSNYYYFFLNIFYSFDHSTFRLYTHIQYCIQSTSKAHIQKALQNHLNPTETGSSNWPFKINPKKSAHVNSKKKNHLKK